MFVGEEKEVVINDTKYDVKALPAIKGLQLMTELEKAGSMPPPDLVRAVVLESVTVNSIQPTDEWFNKHFSRNYKELYELFSEIVDFNFGKVFAEGKGEDATQEE